MRVCLRRIRSLLRPLRGCPGATRLDRAAAELGRLTTPLRDLEVLIAELARHRLDWQANVRQSDLQARYRQLLAHPQIIDFPSLLHAWPRRFRRTARRTAKHRLNRRLQRQQQQLRRALADTGYDRHRLRLLIKRLRYAAEAYPQRLPLSPAAMAGLKAAQSALGDWHDREVWCLQAEHQADSGPCCPGGKLSNARRWPRRTTCSPPYHRRWRRKPAAHHDPEKRPRQGTPGPENAR
ncbi:CHAD domain-containing protein [Serratia marcescens]